MICCDHLPQGGISKQSRGQAFRSRRRAYIVSRFSPLRCPLQGFHLRGHCLGFCAVGPEWAQNMSGRGSGDRQHLPKYPTFDQASWSHQGRKMKHRFRDGRVQHGLLVQVDSACCRSASAVRAAVSFLDGEPRADTLDKADFWNFT